MKKLLIANWKCNPDSNGRAVRLARETESVTQASKNLEVVVTPPFPFLAAVGNVLRTAKLGAQDAFWEDVGPYTGEVSWHQLKHLRVSYVIIGHSERRALGETDEIVNKKVRAALKAGLRAILCVGEPLAVRKKGIAAAKRFVQNQLVKDLGGIRNLKLEMRNLAIAYEPVWAISTSGTGKADTPEDAALMARFIKRVLDSRFQILNSKVLYGGSVTSGNAKRFLCAEAIDGALVGGASLRAEDFKKIIKIASEL